MSRRPNILTIVTDQQRADTLHALGNPLIKTPVLDRLAESGMTFARAYTPSPVCMAARCALATGLHPTQSLCWDNHDMPLSASSYMEALRHFGSAEETEAVEEGRWRRHEAMPWPDDPDYGLLRQDPPGLREMLEDIRPYFDGKLPAPEDGCKAIFDHMP